MADEQKKDGPGLRNWFWKIANKVAGKDARRKTGALTALLGAIATILAYLINGKVGLVLLITGCVAIVTGLMMRFFPDAPSLQPAEEPKKEVKAVTDESAEFLTGAPKTGDDVLAERAKALGIHESKWTQIAGQVKEGKANKPNTLLYNAVVKSAEELELVEVAS